MILRVSTLIALCLIALADNVVRPCRAAENPPGAAKTAVDGDHGSKMAAGLKLFRSKVRGVLIENCVSCHGGEETESDFDLTTREGLLRGGEEGEAVEEFVLIERGSSVSLACYFLGYALCGILILRIGEVMPISSTHRLLNIGLGVPLIVILVVLLALLEDFVGEAIAQSLFNLSVPIIAGIVLPNLTRRFVHPRPSTA